MQLEDRVCLVTGAARRVGRAIALEFARRGARLVIHYHGSRAEALQTAEDCARLAGGREAIALSADQSDPADIDRLVKEAIRQLGRIDVLVNSASIFKAMPFLEMKQEDWDRMFDVNVRGPAWFCRAVAPGMLERREGCIVNMTDVSSEIPWPRFLPYCATKAALVNLTLGLARELAPHVRVNGVSPGTVLPPESAGEEVRERAAHASLLGRIGAPEDVARTCVFLVEGSDFITGAIVPVDGGRRLVGGQGKADFPR